MDCALAEKYKNLTHEKEICKKLSLSYYSIQIKYKNLFKSENCEKECYRFIEQHFNCGKKMTAISDILGTNEDIKTLSESIRSVHMVSLYLLGYSLYQCFEDDLNKYFMQYIGKSDRGEEYDFRYTWFLTALFHDITSCKEVITKHNEIEGKQSIENVIKSEKNIYDYKLQSGKKFIPKFPKDFVLRYLKEREEKDRVDHGIVAGYNFFNSMCTIFEQKLGEEEIIVEKTNKERMLMWDKTYMDHFVFIADAIISHNIWFDEKTEKMVGKWAYEENPLNFILCLLDTIEPIKRFCEDKRSTLKYNEVLENISVIKDDERKIKISWNDVIRNCELEKWERWKDNIKKLDEWMKIDVEEGSDFLILRW